MESDFGKLNGRYLWASAVKTSAVAIVCSACILWSGLASAAAADINVRQAWGQATPKGAEVAAGYLTIENRGDSPDRLLKAHTPAAGEVEIHEMRVTGGVMRMRPVSEGLTIPPKDTLVLLPHGSHLMFLRLRAPFAAGERIPVALDFEKAGRINIDLEVGQIGAKGPQPSAGPQASYSAIVRDAEPFFTHLHDPRVMANVTVSPGRAGPVEVLVQLEDPQENALAATELSLTLTGPDNRIAPITGSAERITSDSWRTRFFVSEAGKWTLALRIGLTVGERIELAAPILIE